MKEIESLLLQIAKPKGNVVGGKPAGSQNLKARLGRLLRTKLRRETDMLIGKVLGSSKRGSGRTLKSDRASLTYLFPKGARLRGERSGRKYSGFVRRNGQVRVKGESYDSPSAAGSAAAGRRVNGWSFWRVQRSPRNWVKLGDIKRAGTPLLPSW